MNPSDPYGFAEHLGPAARRALTNLQTVLDRDIRPLLSDAWETATMPEAVLEALVPLQAAALDPRIRSFELKGGFALTEPEHVSDIAGGLETTATRAGDEWVLDGQKRWIGGARTADVLDHPQRPSTQGAT